MMRTSFAVAALLSVYALGCTLNAPGTGTNPTSSRGTTESSSGSSDTSGDPGGEENSGTSSGTVPNGDTPDELLGKWFSGGEVWDFKAGGAVSHYSSTKGGSCPSEDLDSGTMVSGGASLTVSWTSGLHKSCGGSVLFEANTKEFTYFVENVNGLVILSMTDVGCDAATSKCTNRFDKE